MLLSKCCYLSNCQILSLVILGKTIWHIESAIESFGRNKNRISKSLLVFSLYNYVCTSTQEESSISITITQKFSHSPRLAVPHICPAVALYIQLLFNCPHMHITYFTDVHKSDQVKGLSWVITENIFCRVENLSITFFTKVGETIAYHIWNQQSAL